MPAVARLVTLLENPYATRAPARVGLSHYPGGAAYYRWFVRWHTTLETNPAEVHAIGLREIARIHRGMAAIRRQVGFAGTQARFHSQLARDPTFFATTPEEFGERLMSHATRLEPLLDRAFTMRPRAKGDVQRLPAALAPAMTFGFYRRPMATGPMGHYLYAGTQTAMRTGRHPDVRSDARPTMQITVRTGWDSNPRYRFRHAGFRDRFLQPLGHPS